LNNYKKFTIAIIIFELLLILGANVLIHRTVKEESHRSYLVEIQRAVNEMKSGKSVQDISLDKYKSIVRISEFKANQFCNNDYRVEEVNGLLYRFEYTQIKNTRPIWVVNGILATFFLSTVVIVVYIGKKVIYPFHSMNYLVEELAKGNLSVPIKEEKSKFFGRFLWSVDMLREKLEQDKLREMEFVKEKKTLILSLSHDIKTPLATIDLYTKALLQNLYSTEEKRLEVVKGIEKNAEDIKKYVNEISKASREDFLRFEIDNKEFYLSELMKAIEKYYTEKMINNFTKFIIDKVDDCLIYGDLDRSIEVLQNIIENAIKYGGGEKIHITFADEEECKLVTVTNTGCSLPNEELNHIFDSFYRGSNSEKVKGSGLGLYICKEILHRMDGDIFAKISGNNFKVTVVFRKM